MNLTLGPVISEFVYSVATGAAREIGCFGPRGESKTVGALAAMAMHAMEHFKAGYPLPFPWVGVTDYHRSHKDKTVESLTKPFWEGAWSLYDDDHLAILRGPTAGGDVVDLVKLHLFGIEDEGALDRIRREIGGLWAEEVAPALSGHGVPLNAWLMGITSQRIPTHARVAMFTSNYPDEKHWSWQRMKPGAGFVSKHPDHPERMTFRVPKGDNKFITDQMRQEWREALADRPDLAIRLLEGKPGSVQRGRAVAVKYVEGKPMGFNEEKHVSPKRLYPVKGEPIIMGADGGLCPVVTIGQVIRSELRVFASFVIDAGMRQQFEYNVVPWMKRWAPWALKDNDMIRGCYDSSMPDDESDSDRNPLDVILEQVGGIWDPGPIDWTAREGALFAGFNKVLPGTNFEPALRIDPTDGEPLIAALRGGWFYPTDRFGDVSADKPKKPNHPHEDCGDSFIYWLCAALPELVLHRSKKRPLKVETNFNPAEIRDYQIRDEEIVVESDFNPAERFE